jgi:hypothetical protein
MNYRLPFKPNTSAVEQSGTGWLLNSGSRFPLTITGVGRETAQAIKALLEMSITVRRPALSCLTTIFAETDARIKELDEEIAAGRTEFTDHGGNNLAAENLLSIAYSQTRCDYVRLLRAHDDLQQTTFWKISNVNDMLTCPECRALLGRSYDSSALPYHACRFISAADAKRI